MARILFLKISLLSLLMLTSACGINLLKDNSIPNNGYSVESIHLADFSAFGTKITAEDFANLELHAIKPGQVYDWYDKNDALEIQFIDPQSGTLLACTSIQKIDTNAFEFWDLAAYLKINPDWTNNDVTQVQAILIYRYNIQNCLNGFDSALGLPKMGTRDIISGWTNGITKELLIKQRLSLVKDDGFLVLQASDDPNPLQPTLTHVSGANPELKLDQIKFDHVNDGEGKSPELLIHLLDQNRHSIACLRGSIAEVDQKNILHAALNQPFYELNTYQTILFEDHVGENITVTFSEEDKDSFYCSHPDSEGVQLIFEKTILFDELFGAKIDMGQYGYLQFASIDEQ